ncbi:MAG: hypothetical protein ACLU38_01650 [Dysosmobacter sp.]
MISAIGVRNIVENNVDLTKSRNLIIAAVILVCGLGFTPCGITFTVAGTSITLTGLAIAALAGILLNAILPGNDYEFGVEASMAATSPPTWAATNFLISISFLNRERQKRGVPCSFRKI